MAGTDGRGTDAGPRGRPRAAGVLDPRPGHVRPGGHSRPGRPACRRPRGRVRPRGPGGLPGRPRFLSASATPPAPVATQKTVHEEEGEETMSAREEPQAPPGTLTD